jgi:hypothetical protein
MRLFSLGASVWMKVETGLNSHRKDWRDKVCRRSHSDNSEHAAEMALKGL